MSGLQVPVDGKGQDWPRRVANAINPTLVKIPAMSASITTLQGDVTTAQGNITTLQGNVTTLQGQVAPLVAGHPFQELASAPSSPTEGQTYYDTALHKVRTWDGSLWQDHW